MNANPCSLEDFSCIYLARHHGSLEHPWHFWLGYLLPLAHEIIGNVNRGNLVRVRDCGPMNCWLNTLTPYCDLEIVKPGLLLRDFLSDARSVIFDHWDNPDGFSRPEFLSAVEALRRLLHVDAHSRAASMNRPEIVLLERGPALDFYNSEWSEIRSSAADRRCISNPLDLKASLASLGTTRVVDSSRWDPYVAAAAYGDADILVGQYGAGLANMLWLKQGSLIVEIRAPERLNVDPWDDCYLSLAGAIGCRFVRIVAQANWHGYVECEQVRDAIRADLLFQGGLQA